MWIHRFTYLLYLYYEGDPSTKTLSHRELLKASVAARREPLEMHFVFVSDDVLRGQQRYVKNNHTLTKPEMNGRAPLRRYRERPEECMGFADEQAALSYSKVERACLTCCPSHRTRLGITPILAPRYVSLVDGILC